MKDFWLGLVLLLGLASCKVSDPALRQKALANETYSGFVSREFFQVVVPVDIPRRDMTILEERAYCKTTSFRGRDSQAIALLLNEKRANPYPNENRFWIALFPPKNRFSTRDRERGRTGGTPGSAVSGQSPQAQTPNPGASPMGMMGAPGIPAAGASSALDPGYAPLPSQWNSARENLTDIEEAKERRGEQWLEEEKSIRSLLDPLLYRGDFQWFLETMFLYKEDYSSPGKCKFVYRSIQKGLYQKVLETKLSYDPLRDEPNFSKE